jgi:hypothetical protein
LEECGWESKGSRNSYSIPFLLQVVIVDRWGGNGVVRRLVRSHSEGGYFARQKELFEELCDRRMFFWEVIVGSFGGGGGGGGG